MLSFSSNTHCRFTLLSGKIVALFSFVYLLFCKSKGHHLCSGIFSHEASQRPFLNYFQNETLPIRQAFFSHLLKLRTYREDLLFYLIFHPQFKKYVSYIHFYLFILHGYITNSQYDQLPVGLIAQFVEHCTGIVEVMGSNQVQAYFFFFFFVFFFFEAFFSQLLKLRTYCEDLSST